jgi:hypothetical protein
MSHPQAAGLYDPREGEEGAQQAMEVEETLALIAQVGRA